MDTIRATPWSNLCQAWFDDRITIADLVTAAVEAHGFEYVSLVEWLTDIATPEEIATLRRY